MPLIVYTTLDEYIDDTVAGLLVAGTGIDLVYDDTAGTLTISATGGGGVPDGNYGDITVSGSGTVWSINAAVVTYAKIQNLDALSVFGRSADSSGVGGSIAASADGQVLRRSGTALAFGTIVTAGLANASVTYAKIQNLSGPLTLLGRKSSGAGVVEELTLSDALDFVTSAAQGDLIYRTSPTWVRLPAGTSGQFLKTNGPGADPAWTSVPSVTEATAAEMEAATGSTQLVTPRRVVSSPYAAKVWANIDGTTTPASLRASQGVSAITDNGVGDYSLTLNPAFSSANYAIGTAMKNTGTAVLALILDMQTNALRLATASPTALADSSLLTVVCCGDQ
jgi:hypothetical protein